MYPFVARWPIQYTSALATGEGLAGVVVAIIAAAQNAGTTTLSTHKKSYLPLSLVLNTDTEGPQQLQSDEAFL